MSVITLFTGVYCHGEDVARTVGEELGYELANDSVVIGDAAKRFKIEENKFVRAITGKTSVFNKFTHERERSLACLKVALAKLLRGDNLLLAGFLSHLVPRDISHVLKVCLIADIKYRLSAALTMDGLTEKDALKRIHRDNESRVVWVEHVHNKRDPWAPELYDMLIPMDKHSVSSAAALIMENVRKDILRVTDQSKRAVEDFVLAAEVDLRLAREGHDVSISAKDGIVQVTINKHVLMLSSLEEELKELVGKVPGVRGVETRVGSGYYQTDIYRKFDFDMPLPSKVLLVDDEREFVETLSERLQMRDLGTAVVYGGDEALTFVDEEEPDVMVLDLKMPGVDGLEVLRRVKREHPNVEVIVLTGHGSKEIENLCMEMGASAYLEKPVDIDTLTSAMREAYARIKQRKE